MDSGELVELYFRTTLEIADSHGTIYRIRPRELTQADGDSPQVILDPYQHAFILTAENPESLGLYSAAQNEQATRQLRTILLASRHPFVDCPGYGWDVDHVEPGFAVLATEQQEPEIRRYVIELAEAFRQNAIFHLDYEGLEIIGALRELSGRRRVSITPR